MLKAANHHIVRPKRTLLVRQFTEAEKLQLQSKIRDHQEWRLGATKSESPPGTFAHRGKYAFLSVILCLLAFNVAFLLNARNLTFERFGNLGVALVLLFSHLADNFAKPGLNGCLLKTVYWICGLLTGAGLTYRFWSPYAAKLTVTLLGG